MKKRNDAKKKELSPVVAHCLRNLELFMSDLVDDEVSEEKKLFIAECYLLMVYKYNSRYDEGAAYAGQMALGFGAFSGQKIDDIPLWYLKALGSSAEIYARINGYLLSRAVQEEMSVGTARSPKHRVDVSNETEQKQ